MKIVTQVYPKEFRQTKDPNENLLTKGLEGCIGLVFYNSGSNLRGLGHIYHSGLKDSFVHESQEALNFLDRAIESFGRPTTICLGYVPYQFGKEGYTNPLADEILKELEKKGYVPNLVSPKRINSGQVYFMDIVVKQEEAVFIPKTRDGKFTQEDLYKIKLS